MYSILLKLLVNYIEIPSYDHDINNTKNKSDEQNHTLQKKLTEKKMQKAILKNLYTLDSNN